MVNKWRPEHLPSCSTAVTYWKTTRNTQCASYMVHSVKSHDLVWHMWAIQVLVHAGKVSYEGCWKKCTAQLWNLLLDMDESRLMRHIFIWDKQSKDISTVFCSSGSGEAFFFFKWKALICLENLCAKDKGQWADDIWTKPKLHTFTMIQTEYVMENYVVYNLSKKQTRKNTNLYMLGWGLSKQYWKLDQFCLLLAFLLWSAQRDFVNILNSQKTEISVHIWNIELNQSSGETLGEKKEGSLLR